MEELKDCSVVTASYRLGDGKVQTIARYPDKGWLEIEQVYDRGVPRTETRDEARTTHADHPGSFQFTDPEHLRWDVSKGVYLKG